MRCCALTLALTLAHSDPNPHPSPTSSPNQPGELLRAAPWLPVLSYHLYPLGAGNGTARDVASKAA